MEKKKVSLLECLRIDGLLIMLVCIIGGIYGMEHHQHVLLCKFSIPVLSLMFIATLILNISWWWGANHDPIERMLWDHREDELNMSTLILVCCELGFRKEEAALDYMRYKEAYPESMMGIVKLLRKDLGLSRENIEIILEAYYYRLSVPQKWIEQSRNPALA